MSDYTPTTNRVRNSYANDIASYPTPANVFEADARADSAKEEFDRWLAEHARKVKAEAWDEGHKHRHRLGQDECQCDAWNIGECACGLYGTGELLSLNDNPYRDVSK